MPGRVVGMGLWHWASDTNPTYSELPYLPWLDPAWLWFCAFSSSSWLMVQTPILSILQWRLMLISHSLGSRLFYKLARNDPVAFSYFSDHHEWRPQTPQYWGKQSWSPYFLKFFSRLHFPHARCCLIALHMLIQLIPLTIPKMKEVLFKPICWLLMSSKAGTCHCHPPQTLQTWVCHPAFDNLAFYLLQVFPLPWVMVLPPLFFPTRSFEMRSLGIPIIHHSAPLSDLQ